MSAAVFERWSDAWRNTEPSRRLLIAVPVVALVVVALYVGAIEPLQAASRNLRASLPALEARRDAIRAQARELRTQSAPATQAPQTAKPTSAALDAASIQPALARHQLADLSPVVEGRGENRLRLHLPRAPFFSIWPLFQTLQTDQGIRVVALRVDKLDAANARVEALVAAGER